jgi:hypothetical protein
VILRRIVIPLVATYALFVGMAVTFLRRPHPLRSGRNAPARPWTRSRALREVVLVIGCGYVFFILIVLVFHVLIAGDRGALRSAAIGGAFLAFGVAAPVFLADVWWRSRRAPGR